MTDNKNGILSRVEKSVIALWGGPVIVCILLCTFTIIIWQKLEKKEADSLSEMLLIETDYHKSKIKDDVKNKVSALKQIAKIWNLRQSMTKEEFDHLAKFTVSDIPGFKAIEWVDSNYKLQWVVSHEENKRFTNINFGDSAFIENEIKKTIDYNVPSLSSLVDLVSGEKGLLIIIPLNVDSKFNGLIIGLIDVETWLEKVFMSEKILHRYDACMVSVSIDNRQIYSESKINESHKTAHRTTAVFELMNHEIRMIIQPGKDLLEHSRISVLNYAVISGFMLSIIFSVILFLLQQSRLQKKMIQKVNQKNESEIIENRKRDQDLKHALTRIDIATKAGNIGIWSMDLKTGVMTWSDRMFDLFDLPSDTLPAFDKMKLKLTSDDQVKIDTLEKNAIAGIAKFDTELCIIGNNKSTRQIRISAKVERDQVGEPQFITGLCWDITDQRKGEQTIWHLSEMRKIIMEISSQNINISSSEAPGAIQRALKRMGEFVNADRVYVSKYDFSTHQLTFTYEWCNEGIVSHVDKLKNVPAQGLLEWITSHFVNEPIYISDIGSLPVGNWRSILELQEIKSIVTVPMIYENEIIGFVGFESVKEKKDYSENELDLLKLFAQTLVNIHARSMTETALQESEEKIHLILNSAGEAIFGVDSNNICIFANHSAARILGYPNALLFLGKNFHDLVKHSDKYGKMISSDDCSICNAIKSGESIHNDNEMFHKADDSGIYVEYWSHAQIVNGKITGAVVTFVDITERRLAEDAFKQARENFETFFNTNDDFLFVLDTNGNIIHINETVKKRLGYTKEELEGKSILMIHPEERREEAAGIVKEMMDGLKEFCPIPIITKSGSMIPVETRVRKGNWNNKPVLFGITKDISRIKLSEEKFSKVFYINPCACGLTELESHRFVEVNEAFYNLFGFEHSEVIGKTAYELNIFKAGDIERIQSTNDMSGKIYNAEADMYKKNGEVIHCLMSSDNIYIQDKKYRFTLVYDITERKKMQVQLTEERWKLNSILEGTNVGTWEWNVQTGETVFNERWAEIIGYSLDELMPVSIKTWEMYIHPDDLQKSNDELDKHFSGKSEYYVCEVRLKHRNGNWVWVLDKGKVATWTNDGKPLFMYGTHQDITQVKEAAEEREKLISKLEKSLLDVHKLSGMLPICASCKRIRDDKGYWNQIETYIKEHSEAEFTHGLCPECVVKLYPELTDLNLKKPE